MALTIMTIVIPETLSFADLKLTREADGSVSMDMGVIEQISEASGLSPELLSDGFEDNVARIVMAWYQDHLADGGDRDKVQDDLIAEAMIESAKGQDFSYAPGCA